MSRVAAIGLDAAEWSVVERLVDEGTLPNLAALRERSARCRLENVVPYRSELPWTQYLTGKTADTNRYWSTVVFDPSEYHAYCIGAHPAKPFYELGPDTKVIAFDLPHSTIREDLHGVQVTAWGAHSAQYPRASRPAGLLREIDARFGTHPAFENDYDGGWHQPEFLDALGEALIEGSRRRVDIARWLLEREPDWDLFLTVLSESHSGGHHFWHGADPAHPLHRVAATSAQAGRWLVDVYKVLDEGVGRIAEALPSDATLVVFAVHGMQVNANDVPSLGLLPELAHRLHFGEALVADPDRRGWERSGHRPLSPPERLIWRQWWGRRFAADAAGRRRRALRFAIPDTLTGTVRAIQHRLTGKPRMAWELADRAEPESDLSVDEMTSRRQSLRWQPPAWYRPWWPQMRWFVLPTFSDAHVRINLRGRERDGVVALDDYERACAEVEATVRACRNPRTGNPVVDEVVRLRSDDPMDPDGPDADLVVIWSEAADALEHPDVGLVGPMPFQRTGEHSANGFAFISGPGIEPRDLGTRSAFDITPTLVAFAGHDPSEHDFEGTAMLSPAITA